MADAFPNDLIPTPARVYRPSAAGDPVVLAAKSSADVLDYALDISAVLAGTTDTVTGAALLAPAGTSTHTLVAVWSQRSGAQIVLMLASGPPRTIVRFALEITTAQQRRFVQPLQITITGASVATDPPASGTVLTVNGQTVTIGGTAVAITPGTGEIAAAPLLDALQESDFLAVSREVNGIQTLYRVDGGMLGSGSVGPQGPKGDAGPQGPKGDTGLSVRKGQRVTQALLDRKVRLAHKALKETPGLRVRLVLPVPREQMPLLRKTASKRRSAINLLMRRVYWLSLRLPTKAFRTWLCLPTVRLGLPTPLGFRTITETS